MITRILALALGAILAMTAAVQAHGPSRQKVEMSVLLNATPDEVWDAIGKFEDMSWHPAVASTEITGDGSVDTPDVSTRVLHLKADGADPTITETLMTIAPEKHMYKYMITDVAVEVLPVTNYSSTLMVKDQGGKAEVIWKSGFYRGDPNGNPPENLNDAAAIAAVTGVYQAGLDALAERFGKAE